MIALLSFREIYGSCSNWLQQGLGSSALYTDLTIGVGILVGWRVFVSKPLDAKHMPDLVVSYAVLATLLNWNYQETLL
jgi:hypothetical protein